MLSRKQARPRSEKIRAVAKQLVNFVSWQRKCTMPWAEIVIVGCDELCQSALQARMQQLLNGPLPAHLSFSNQEWVTKNLYFIFIIFVFIIILAIFYNRRI
jgi:hypothetical protein